MGEPVPRYKAKYVPEIATDILAVLQISSWSPQKIHLKTFKKRIGQAGKTAGHRTANEDVKRLEANAKSQLQQSFEKAVVSLAKL